MRRCYAPGSRAGSRSRDLTLREVRAVTLPRSAVERHHSLSTNGFMRVRLLDGREKTFLRHAASARTFSQQSRKLPESRTSSLGQPFLSFFTLPQLLVSLGLPTQSCAGNLTTPGKERTSFHHAFDRRLRHFPLLGQDCAHVDAQVCHDRALVFVLRGKDGTLLRQLAGLS